MIALAVGLALATYSYQMITDPQPAIERSLEEQAVQATRDLLGNYLVDAPVLNIVDPLAPDRKVGKSYVFPKGDGWQVSGFYQRAPGGRWYPFLATLGQDFAQQQLDIKDDDVALQERAGSDPKFSVVVP